MLFETATERGPLIVRHAEAADVDRLSALHGLCLAAAEEQDAAWNRAQLHNRLRLFPDGQIVAALGGEVVGAVASLIVNLGADPYRAHTHSGITDGGFFHNHDPSGDTLYGADIAVHPDARGIGVGAALYRAWRELCRRLNLRRILAGARPWSYADHAGEMTPEEYVRRVEIGELRDRVLSFQLREGFVARGVLRDYVRDPRSSNCAVLIEWLNPDHRPRTEPAGKVRVACVQYRVRGVEGFDHFAAQVEYFVQTAAAYHSDFVVFPEFFSAQLLSQQGLAKLPPFDGIRKLAELWPSFLELLEALARRHGVMIVGGSHPVHDSGLLYNVSPLVLPDGRHYEQRKLHVTPAEKRDWGITGGNSLRMLPTPKANVGILVCYDAEFPETARHLADQGAEIVFVPYCTDNRAGHLRVRYCCQARAIENQVYVATAGIVGNLPSVPSMDVHYGQAAVYTPSDFEFARDGVQAEADSNVEMLLVTDLDVADLHRSRASGSVTPRLDRRKDLFEFRSTPALDGPGDSLGAVAHTGPARRDG